jgi:hypothetical protein
MNGLQNGSADVRFRAFNINNKHVRKIRNNYASSFELQAGHGLFLFLQKQPKETQKAAFSYYVSEL